MDTVHFLLFWPDPSPPASEWLLDATELLESTPLLEA